MRTSDCDICNGAGSILLPVRHRVVATFQHDRNIEPSPAVSSRRYACPECSAKVDHGHVARVFSEQEVVAHNPLPDGYMQHVRRSAAHDLVDHLLGGGYITQVHGPVDKQRMTFTIRSELGVVSPQFVSTLEARIAERQGEVAAKVADEAVRLIELWGSHYGRDAIEKSHARRFVMEALRNVTSEK